MSDEQEQTPAPEPPKAAEDQEPERFIPRPTDGVDLNSWQNGDKEKQ
jgi:hypothetical protein